MIEICEQCKALKIPISKNINPEIAINKRAKSRFGACKKTDKGYLIEVSESILGLDVDRIKNVLAHEILHTCPGCYNHGKRWKAYASKLNVAYGYNIKTTTSYEEMGLHKPEKRIQYKYKIQCQKCGKTFYRQKRSKLITHIQNYRCTCGGQLKCFVNQNEKAELP